MSELSPARFVREDLRALGAYTLDQASFRHKLDQNEVPWDFPRRLKREALRRLESRDWARYPDFHADGLRRRLAERLDWPFEGVLVGNGSNELLGVLLEAVAGPGVEVLGALPSFGLYEMFVRRSGAVPCFLPPRADLRLPIDELLAAVDADPRRPLLLCSPNNPTGDAASAAQIGALLERLASPLLLDNAYGEFCRHDYLPLLRRHRNLVVLRTFSKAWSLGGVRLGYLLADPELVTELIKVKLPYNVGLASVAIGEVALEHPASAERAVRTLIGRRAQWADALRGLGLEVFPSEANFLLVRTSDPVAVQRGLAARAVLVRKVSHYPGLAGCFRVAVGSGRDLRATVAALREVLAEGAAAGAATTTFVKRSAIEEQRR
jgi:histidinol-phosphate aminotransferase